MSMLLAILNLHHCACESPNDPSQLPLSTQSIRMVAEALQSPGGTEATGLRVAERYIDAFRELAKSSTTMLLPSSASDPASMVAQVGVR